MMDPERQELLRNPTCEYGARRRRALTYEEVLRAHRDPGWRRVRCLLMLLFWTVIAMFLSMAACILLSTTRCHNPSDMPSVPPAHLNLAPLIRTCKTSAV